MTKLWKVKEGEIHLWHIPFDEKKIELKLLSSREIAKGNAFKFPTHKHQFWLYRTMLRKVLSLYSNIPPEKICFSYSEFGKPSFENNASLQFNLSHSQNLGVIALTHSSPVGVDIEEMKTLEDFEEIVKQFFSKKEYADFQQIPVQEQLDPFYTLWTCKEAFVKALGEGLSYPLDQFSISWKKPPTVLEIQGSRQEASLWSIQSYITQSKMRSYKVSCLVKNNVSQLKKIPLFFDSL